MPQNELIVDVLRSGLGFLQMTLADMTDADLVQRPVPNANTALWQIGHLIKSEANMINGCAGRTVVELPAGFADRYKRETATETDASKLGSKAELMALYQKLRNQIADWVATLSPDELAKPSPESLRGMVPTVGHVLQLLPAHTGMHVGQIQVLRRKLGKPLLF